MTIKTTKLAGALFAALTVAAPLALSATPAEAAPHRGGGFHVDPMRDRGHRPATRFERRPHQPHGHYRWRAGAWNWSRDHWVWAPGIWMRF